MPAGNGTLGLWLAFSEIANGALCAIVLLMMRTADIYRKIAASLRDRASYERMPDLAARWEELAGSYLRLANEAEDSGSAPAEPEPDSKQRPANEDYGE